MTVANFSVPIDIPWERIAFSGDTMNETVRQITPPSVAFIDR